MKNAEVKILKNDHKVASSKTASDGSYSIENIDPGEYKIEAKKNYRSKGFELYAMDNVSVSSWRAVTYNIELLKPDEELLIPN